MEPNRHYYNLLVECLHYYYNGEKFKSLTLDFSKSLFISTVTDNVKYN